MQHGLPPRRNGGRSPAGTEQGAGDGGDGVGVVADTDRRSQCLLEMPARLGC